MFLPLQELPACCCSFWSRWSRWSAEPSSSLASVRNNTSHLLCLHFCTTLKHIFSIYVKMPAGVKTFFKGIILKQENWEFRFVPFISHRSGKVRSNLWRDETLWEEAAIVYKLTVTLFFCYYQTPAVALNTVTDLSVSGPAARWGSSECTWRKAWSGKEWIHSATSRRFTATAHRQLTKSARLFKPT